MEFTFPDVGEGIHEAELVRWFVKKGEIVKEHQAIAEVETDKAVVELPSPYSGTVTKLHAKPGDTIKVGQVIATIGKAGKKERPEQTAQAKAKTAEAKTAKKKTTQTKPTAKPSKGVSIVGEIEAAEETLLPAQEPATERVARAKALPRVRKLAQEKGVDLNTIDKERITEEDVLAAAAPRKPRMIEDDHGKVLEIPLKGIRKTSATNVSKSWAAIPHVTHHDEADLTRLWDVRKKENKKTKTKVTFLPFVTRAVLQALHQHRFLNSSHGGQTIQVKQYFNIGIAVDTEHGLIVPNIKNADKKSLLELAKEMAELAKNARNKKLKLENVKGGTFTITNIGSIGGRFFTPIINAPEAAILGIGRIHEQAVLVDGAVEARKIMPLSLSYDHRVVDGAAAARFMNDIVSLLEEPERITRKPQKTTKKIAKTRKKSKER